MPKETRAQGKLARLDSASADRILKRFGSSRGRCTVLLVCHIRKQTCVILRMRRHLDLLGVINSKCISNIRLRAAAHRYGRDTRLKCMSGRERCGSPSGAAAFEKSRFCEHRAMTFTVTWQIESESAY